MITKSFFRNSILIFLFFLVFTIGNVSLVLAAQPTIVVPNPSNSLELRVTAPEVFKQDQARDIYVHVFNATNDMPVITGITCYFHLYGYPKGEHIGSFFDAAPSHLFDYEFEIPASNFTVLGNHRWIAQCNFSNTGGATYGVIEITPTGDDNNNTIFLVLIISSVILLLLGFVFHNYVFSTISGFAFMITGVYSMINGFAGTATIYTRFLSFIIIGIGMIISVTSAFELAGETEGPASNYAVNDVDDDG
jgi:disulfide bond formation protein DsbB